MPSVINANTSPSEIDFVSDKPIFYSEQLSSSSSSLSKDSSKPTIQDLKESNRRRQQWNDPDDEFSVPIHTEFPLISKSPLDMASFLLNHRTMHRSIEIMTPPVETSTNSTASSSFYPSIPDGPIYIHHRSTMTGSPLSSVVTCSHVNCYEHNRLPYSIARSGSSACHKDHLLSASHHNNDQEDSRDLHSHPHSNLHYTYSKGPSSSIAPSSATGSNRSTSQQKPSFLVSHIASIDQWLSSKSGSV